MPKARVIELPLPLSPDGKISLAILAAQPASDVGGFTIHLSKNYDFDGSPVDSYAALTGSTKFAQRGVLRSDYPADTDLVDRTVGFSVALDAPNQDLPEMNAFDGVSDEWLVFLGDEILSLHRADLITGGVYLVFCLRARFGTVAAAHADGTECYIVRRTSLEAVQHPQIALHNAYAIKLASVKNTVALDLAEATPLEGTVAGRIYREPKPANLRAHGTPPGSGTDAENGFYAPGHDIVVQWTNTDTHADFYQAGKLTRAAVLEVYNDADALVATLTLTGDTTTIPNLTLVGYLGGETDFTLRLFYRTTVEFGHVDTDKLTLGVVWL